MQGKGQGSRGKGVKAGSSMIAESKREGRGRALSFDIFVASPLAFRHVIIDE